MIRSQQRRVSTVKDSGVDKHPVLRIGGGWRAAATVGIAGVLFLQSSCGREKHVDLPVVHHRGERPVMCRVDTEHVLRAVPRGLFGTNLEWFNYAGGMARADGSVDENWVRLAREQGVDNVRFPGGTLADFYFWRDGIGPVDKRQVREHPTDTGKSPNVFGTPEFLRFCEATGARPLITVNAGTSTPQDAAGWVAYCNQPDNRERVADGLAKPAKVSLWEIGNELYLPGNPTDKKIITVTPDVYADRFLAFAQAMRNVDPSIKLMAIGTANASAIPLPHPDWSETVLRKAAGQMDFIAVHNSYFPMIFGQRNLSHREVYQSLMAAPEAVDRSLSALDELITKHENGRRIEIAVTEWGALFSFDPAWIDHVKTMGTSVYLARLIQVYLNQPRVTVADYFKFTDRTFMGWIGYDQRPKIPYYVVQLFARHFGSRLVQTTVDSPVYSVKPLGVMVAANNVPEVTAVAALSGDGRKLFVNLVNRSWDTVHQVTLDTGKFHPIDEATAWVISAPGLTDHNGRDLPPEIPSRMFDEPVMSADAPGPVSLQSKPVDLKSTIEVPPYSIVTLELTARP